MQFCFSRILISEFPVAASLLGFEAWHVFEAVDPSGFMQNLYTMYL